MSTAEISCCLNCGMTFDAIRRHFKQRGLTSVIVTVCPRCGHVLDPHVEIKPSNEGTDAATRVYGSIVEGGA